MRESLLLMARALVRGHVLTLLLAAVALVHGLLPALVRGDGTAAGGREMFLRAVPGAVVAVVLTTVLACACGALAREREAHRLALTAVRPAPAFVVVAGRWLALCVLAAAALGVNAALTAFRFPGAPDCQHHHAPSLPPAGVVAQKMLEAYLADPSTPEAVRKAPRRAVLALLTNKEGDRYDAVPPGGSMAWPFGETVEKEGLTVRVCFATTYSTRLPVRGLFTFGGAAGAVSNETQSVVDIPLRGHAGVASELVFRNDGPDSVMLRPRRDLELLSPADGFAANLLRATLQSFATIALLAAFGLFLSAALSRPVAVFTALVLVAVALMAPSAVEQFPDELEVSLANRIGLWLSRGVSVLTAAFAAPSPVTDLATGRCVEWPALARTLVEDLVVWPAAFLSLAAVLVRRKPLP